jgi:myo-inositol catabolism protein IolS
MLYRPFGKTGWEVSAIGMGTWNIGNQWGEVDDVTAWATIRACFEHGMNLFDTAESYGMPNGLSEERLGVALAGIRHQVYIVSKIGHWGERTGQSVPKTTVDMIRLCCHASLHRLRTDCIDVMLCHEGNIEDPSVYLEAFEILKQRGRIREYGISTDSLDVLKRLNADGNCSVVQVNYSLLNRRAEPELLPYCQEHNIAVMIRGPLAQGLLSGRYSADSVFTDSVRSRWHTDEGQRARFEANVAKVEQLKKMLKPGAEMVTAALRFTISHPANPVAIPGAKSPEQAVMNAAAGEKTLTQEEIDKLVGLLE